MSVLAAAVPYVGAACEVCLVWCLLRRGLWRGYPYFSFFVIWVAVRTFTLFIFPPAEYPSYYWNTGALDVGLRFLVVWEVFRHAFPKGSSLNVLLSRGFAVVATTLSMLAVGTLWGYHAYSTDRSLATALERSFSFTQAVLVLGLLLASRHYGLSLGRHLRGIAIAFGAWASVSTANNAIYDLTSSFLPYWQIVRPLSFVALIGAWTWVLWKDVPDARIAEPPVQVSELSAWTENWDRTMASVRRVKQS